MGYESPDAMNVLKRNLVEIIREEEVRERLGRGSLRCYVGYEPPQRVHIGWLVWMLKLRDMQ